MKRPIVFILLFLLYGILAGQHLYKVLGVVLFMLVTIAFALLVSRIYRLDGAKLLAVTALIGFILGSNSLGHGNKALSVIADSGIKPYINCTVLDISKKYNGYNKYTVRVNQIKANNTVYNDGIKLYMYSSADLKPGDIAEIKAELKSGRNAASMREYKEKYYMLSRHIRYKISGYAYAVGYKSSLNTFMYKLRTKISAVYDKALPKYEADLLKAIILGDRLELDEDMYELFRNAGIVHIIAVSGLHISIFAAILMALFGRYNKVLANILLMILLFLYALLTGRTPSVVRAVIMMYVFIIGSLLGRDYDIISSCAFACILLLVYSPCYIYDMGFQYSFAAVFIIGMVSDILNKYHIRNGILSALAVSLAVSLGVKPITLYYFGYINFVDIPVNIIVISLMGILVFFGGACGIAGLVSAKAAVFVSGLPYVILKGIEKLSALSLTMPLSHIETHIHGFGVFAAYAVMFAAYMLIVKRSGTLKNSPDTEQGGDFLEGIG